MPSIRIVPPLLLLLLLTGSSPRTQTPAPPLQRPLDPVGDLVLDAGGRPAEGSLPVAFVRSPDVTGPDGGGRYLVVVNSGYGVQFTAKGNRGQQLLQVIDLNATPAPVVVQSVYFPSPQSVNVGVVFGRHPGPGGGWPLYASGGFGNQIWRFTFSVGASEPIAPRHDADSGPLTAPSIDVSAMAISPVVPGYNEGHPPVYPTGLAISSDGRDLYVANNLGDSLGIVHDEAAHGARAIALADPSRRRQFLYPYDVRVVRQGNGADKVYVSCWNDSALAVVDPRRRSVVGRIPVGSHPNAMVTSADGRRLFVASGNSDSVSIIDTATDRELERVPVGLTAGTRLGNSSQALALSDGERVLFVANALTQSIGVVALGRRSMAGASRDPDDWGDKKEDEGGAESRVIGYLPTARYPSALAVVGGYMFIGNGKGEPGALPNAPTPAFPPTSALRGAYTVSMMRGSVRRVAVPNRGSLAALTSRVLAANGLVDPPVERLFTGRSPITHVIYIIKENRSYDQVFGDLGASGDGTAADGDPSLAIFGMGETARRPGGPPQRITPNLRALALRFGLFDRFFVNSEASPDGHNWATAAVSTDYVDKAFRWSYSGRGRTYDYEGFNRVPDVGAMPPPPGLRLPATAETLASFMKRFVPYLNGWRDAAEPDSLYLWDAAERAGLSHRNYGEFIGTLSADDVTAVNRHKEKTYPDVSSTVAAIPAKAALEHHFSTEFRAFDLWTPDAFTTESYRAARESGSALDPLITRQHADPRFRGVSRIGVWMDEFRSFVADVDAGKPDRLPALSIMKLPNDHTSGLKRGHASPQFLVADNDYALGRLVDEVSHSSYWKSTAILVVEDDAQDGPDHVDAHRSPALVVSAYNRPGQLVHAFHNTVSLIRTLELLLGIAPMNVIDASAIPMDIFQDVPDLTPYSVQLPEVADDNLVFTGPRTAAERHWMNETAHLALGVEDAADPRILNQVIWHSVVGATRPMPPPARLALVDAIRATTDEAQEEDARATFKMAMLAIRRAAEGKRP